MKRKRLVFLFTIFILIIFTSILILHYLAPSEQPGYLELLDVKEERVGGLYCNVFNVTWHGRTTDLYFLLYRRSRMAGRGVPGRVTAQWIKTNGDIVGVKDHGVCAAKNGDKFKLTISICCAYIRIYYDNKTIDFCGMHAGEMTEIDNTS